MIDNAGDDDQFYSPAFFHFFSFLFPRFFPVVLYSCLVVVALVITARLAILLWILSFFIQLFSQLAHCLGWYAPFSLLSCAFAGRSEELLYLAVVVVLSKSFCSCGVSVSVWALCCSACWELLFLLSGLFACFGLLPIDIKIFLVEKWWFGCYQNILSVLTKLFV